MARARTFSIAVLSDQHIDIAVAPRSWELAQAAFRAARDAKVDHVVLAGDTFDCSTAMRRDAPVVSAYLHRLGLWRRDRLTIVPGNHDIFHTPHHGTLAQRAVEAAGAFRGDAQSSYDTFCEWVDELIAWEDVLDPDQDDFFPHHKTLEHVHLFAADSTAAETTDSGNGFWAHDADNLLRGATEARDERRILALHHPPYQDRAQKIADFLKQEFPFGFPPAEFRRLSAFLGDAEVDAAVCGHIHNVGDGTYRWRVGATDVFMVGRTGGLHDVDPLFGILEVPQRGRVRWRELPVR
jgi:predicted phosphodiesterase